jgi:DNA-directed RNA polymerase specialized sigma24 family protein
VRGFFIFIMTRLRRLGLTILRQIADGKMDGFDLLVARYSKRLLDYLSSRIRDFHTAENLSQETFIRILQAARKG